jgi:hypothetical protein
MGMGPSQGGIAAGVPSKGGASARYARQYVQPSQQPDPYGGMQTQPAYMQTQPAYMQTQPAQPVRQIGDMSFVEPAVMPPSGTFGAPSFADAQPGGNMIAPAQPAVMPTQPRMRESSRERYILKAPPKDYDPSVHQLGFGVMQQPTQGPAQIPAGMQGDQLREQQAALDAMNQARQAGLQVGPTPNQPPNPYERMGIGQLQQMNEMIRMQQMQADAAMRNQVPWYMRPPGMNERPSPYSSPSQPYQRQMPYQMPYQQPMYQQPYQPAFQRPMSPFGYGGLAALFSRMRGF